MRTRILCVAVLIAASCARTSTTTTTWLANDAPPRAGTVESVQEVVRRVEGDPVGGAVIGALIGGILFGHDGRASLVGAAAGAAVGAAASEGSAEDRSYQVVVRFDDGTRGLFVFKGYTPFTPGQRVSLTAQGLHYY